MRVVDLNVLLYAVNPSAVHHEASRRWLDQALGGADRVGFAAIVQVGFARLATLPAVFPRPYPVDDAIDQLEEWMAAPGAIAVAPGAAHLRILRSLMQESGASGNLVNDAHLAAVAIEQRGDLVTYDRDVTRFTSVRSRTPEQLLDAS